MRESIFDFRARHFGVSASQAENKCAFQDRQEAFEELENYRIKTDNRIKDNYRKF